MEALSNLHPAVVHFPIAFFILYFIMETTGVILKKEYFTKAALFVLALGVLTSLIAVLTGNQAHEIVKSAMTVDHKNINDLIDQHEMFATLSLWYFTFLISIRIYLSIKNKFDYKYGYLFILLGAIGIVLIIYTSYYGGVLVFEHGIGTKLFK